MESTEFESLQERRWIMQAAVSRFVQQGFAETSTQDLAQESGLPPELGALRRGAALAPVIEEVAA